MIEFFLRSSRHEMVSPALGQFPKSACVGNNSIYDFVVIMKLKRPQLVPKGSIVRLLQAAEQAWSRQDFQQNLELLERAHNLNPSNPSILLQLGRVQGLRFNYAAAEEYFEKAVRLSNHKAEMLSAAGMQSRDFYNPALAEKYLRQAAEQKNASPGMLVQLAELYEFLRRPADANQLVERALQLDRAFPPALLALAKLERQAGRFEKAEMLLRSLLPTADQNTRVRSNYLLGAILDHQGRYDEAMSAFIEAKSTFQSWAGQFFIQRQIVGAHLREMLTSISAEIFQRWFDFGREMLQPPRRLGLLCGHPRSGTTLLEQVLDSHPDIISAEETNIFYEHVYIPLARARPQEAPRPGLPLQFQMSFPVELSVLEAAQTDLIRQSRQTYFHNMELCLGQPINNRLLIDKNPSFSLMLLGFQRVFPEIKLLVALRDPRDVCLSCFMQHFTPLNLRNSAYLNLKDTVEEYVEDMNIWRTLAPLIQGRHLEVRYEDIVNDLESVSRRTLDFLGVPWDAKVLHFDEHARQKRVRTPSYADVAKPVFKTSIGRWRNYQKYLEPYLHRLEPFVKAFGYE
jgi:Tfp pilus assembly protein PilF